MAVSPSSDFAPSLSAELTPVKVNVNNTVTSGVALVALAAWPPGSPADAQTAILELPSTYDPVGGKAIRWAFVYNSADSVWDFIGGPPLYAEVLTAEVNNNVGYADLATVGPAVTIPRPGDYVIAVGHEDSQGNATRMAYSGAGITVADDDSTLNQGRPREKTGLSGAAIVTAKYKLAAGGFTCARRWITATPVRIT